MLDHHVIDERSLAFGHAIAIRLRECPELIERARATLHRWLQSCSPRARAALEEWLAVLDQPVESVSALLTEAGERAVRLRQSNPFAGVLAPEERNAILKRFIRHDPAS